MENSSSQTAIAAHPSTSAEIRQVQIQLFERVRALQHEGAANFTAMKAGSPPSRPLSDHERRVTAHVQHLMNGSTPQHLLLPVISRDDQIRAELDAIAFVQRQLNQRMEIALQNEADRWAAENAAEWAALCRELVLTAVRLASLEDRARSVLDHLQRPVKLAMGNTIGSGLSLLGGGDPLAELRTAAIAEKLVTQSDIRKAQNVEK
jgi:hypothetical protein